MTIVRQDMATTQRIVVDVERRGWKENGQEPLMESMQGVCKREDTGSISGGVGSAHC